MTGSNPSSGTYQTLFGLTLTPAMIGLLLGGAGLGGAAYLWSILIPPLQDQSSQLIQEVSGLEAQVQQLNLRRRTQLEALQARAKAQARLQSVQQLFASPQVMNTLLLDVNGRVKLAPGLKLKSYQVKSSAPVTDNALGSAAVGRLKQSTVELVLEGNYASMRQFLQGLEQLQPLLVVSNVKLSSNDSQSAVQAGTSPLTLGLSVAALSPLTPAEREQAAASAKRPPGTAGTPPAATGASPPPGQAPAAPTAPR